MTPTAELETRQAGDANSRFDKAHAGDQKDIETIQAGDQKE